jgi:hypothetical protein
MTPARGQHAAANLDQPVPFTLTPKAHAALARDDDGSGPFLDCGCGYDNCEACAGCGWACQRCGLAFFGTPPDDGLCAACAGTGVGR